MQHFRSSRRWLPVLAVLTMTILFVAGVIVGRTSAAVVNADATWWRAVTTDARADVIHAGIDGYRSGWDDGSTAEGVRIDAALKSAADSNLVPRAAASYVHNVVYQKDAAGHYVSFAAQPQFSKTFGAYAALLDGFYTTNPQATSAIFGDILTCLTDAPVQSCAAVAKAYSP